MIKSGQQSASDNTQLLKIKSNLAEHRRYAEDNLRQIKDIEMKLSLITNDAQLAMVNLCLQNMLQKHQQAIEMLKGLCKIIDNTAISTIRNIN